MYTPQDWKVLRSPMLALGLALVIVGLMAYYADQYHKKQEQALLVEEQAYRQAHQQYQTSGQEKETIIQYLPVYQTLISQGFIGEERRIEWIETLRQAHQDYKLLEINYDISEQAKAPQTYLPAVAELALHQSSMKLELGLVHEGDLLNLLTELQSKFKSFIVNECEIKRVGQLDIRVDDVRENMRANCQIDWFTLRDVKG